MLSKIGKWYSVVFLYKGSMSLTYVARIMLIVMMVVNVVMVVVRKVLVAFGWTTGVASSVAMNLLRCHCLY